MKKTLSLILAAASIIILNGCKPQSVGSPLENIKAKGEIVVYTNPNFAPYEYLGQNNEITGVEMEIVRKFAEKIGVKANIVPAEFDSIIGAVVTGKADLGASGFTITDERKKTVSFSTPFDSSVQYLIIPENSKIAVFEDLAGKKIGCQHGTTGLFLIEDAVNKGQLKDTKAEIKSYNYAPDALVALKNNQCEAVVIDKLVALSLAAKNPGYKAIRFVTKEGKNLGAVEEFGMIVKQGNEELLVILNSLIAEMKQKQEIDELLKKHNSDAAVK